MVLPDGREYADEQEDDRASEQHERPVGAQAFPERGRLHGGELSCGLVDQHIGVIGEYEGFLSYLLRGTPPVEVAHARKQREARGNNPKDARNYNAGRHEERNVLLGERGETDVCGCHGDEAQGADRHPELKATVNARVHCRLVFDDSQSGVLYPGARRLRLVLVFASSAGQAGRGCDGNEDTEHRNLQSITMS